MLPYYWSTTLDTCMSLNASHHPLQHNVRESCRANLPPVQPMGLLREPLSGYLGTGATDPFVTIPSGMLPRCPGTQKVALGESPWAVHGAAFTRQVSRMLCLTGCCYDPRSPLADDDRQLRTHIHWTSLIGSLALDEEDRTEHHLRDERTPLHPKALLNRGLHLKQQGKHSTVYCLAWLWCAVL
jgi:hypothetical protein